MNALALNRENTMVEHQRLNGIEIAKAGMSGVFTLDLTYYIADKVVLSMNGKLMPPTELVIRKENDGVGKKRVYEEYASRAARLFERAIPPDMLIKIKKWNV